MKIISWNCNCKFREKYKELIKCEADIYIIQECENPQSIDNRDYNEFASNYLWIGQNKGLGIFAKKNITLEKLDWNNYCLKYFLPARINNEFDLLAVWACSPYIEEHYIYQNININRYNSNTVIMGDFNSNKIWDKEHGDRNHTAVVNELKKKGLESIYHYINNEKQGNESQATFYLYRHEDKKYHIDHCFRKSDKVKKYSILNDKKWLNYSDHMPIMLEI